MQFHSNKKGGDVRYLAYASALVGAFALLTCCAHTPPAEEPAPPPGPTMCLTCTPDPVVKGLAPESCLDLIALGSIRICYWPSVDDGPLSLIRPKCSEGWVVLPEEGFEPSP